MKKGLAYLLTLALAVGTLAGCGKAAQQGENVAETQQQGTETSEGEGASGIDFSEDPYEVRMLIALPAASPNESEVNRVIEKINEITLKDLNMTLKLEIIPFSSYIEQIQLELSSGSDIDIFTSVSAYGPSWVNAGYLVDMKDLLDQYGQDILASYSSEELATAPNLNGYVFGVPVHKEISQQPTIFFRTDILEKYDLDVSNIKTMADIDALFEEVAAKEPDMWMLAADNLGSAKSIVNDPIGSTAVGAILDPANSTEVVNLFETDEFYEWCSYNHKWFENGWINSGAASDSESYYSYIKSGQAFPFFSDYGHPLSEADQETNCGGVDLTMVTLGEPYATTTTSAVFCYSISSGSEDPAKAMQMLNYIMSSKDVMNLLNWGVEGEDYVVNEDGLLDYPEGKDASTVGYHLGAGWILPNQFVCTPWMTDGADIYEKIIAYNDSSIISKAMGFTFDPAPVADEVAAITNVRAKYYKALIVGAVDPDEYIPIFNEELKEAGSEKVLEEVQRQLDEYLSNK